MPFFAQETANVIAIVVAVMFIVFCLVIVRDFLSLLSLVDSVLLDGSKNYALGSYRNVFPKGECRRDCEVENHGRAGGVGGRYWHYEQGT